MGNDKNFSLDYKLGKKESNVNITGFKAVYERALEMSTTYGKDLPDREKGYVAGVAERLMRHKGHAIDSAELYANVGLINDSDIKKAVASGLIKDAAQIKRVDYLEQIKSFMKKNNMKKFAKGISLENAVMKEGNAKQFMFPLALVVAGVLTSSLSLTGNVVGVSGPVHLLGTGLFFTGLVWAFGKVEYKN